jgi:hypothetical protein
VYIYTDYIVPQSHPMSIEPTPAPMHPCTHRNDLAPTTPATTTTIHIGALELLVTVDHSNNTITMNSRDIMTCLDQLGNEMQCLRQENEKLREQKNMAILLAGNALARLPKHETITMLQQFQSLL